MITGAEIREARALLRWPVARLADLTRIQIGTLNRAEAAEGEAPITLAQEAKIRGVLERAGIELPRQGQPGVRLRKASEA